MKVELEYFGKEEPKTRIINGLPYFSTDGANSVSIEISADISDFKNAAAFVRTLPADININICVFNENNKVVCCIDYWGGEIVEYNKEYCITYKVTKTKPNKNTIASDIFAYNKEMEEAYKNIVLVLASLNRIK